MSMVEVVKAIDGFIYRAVKQGQTKVADFWKGFGAGMMASLFRDAAMSKEAFGLFELAGPEMYAQLKTEMAGLPVETRAGVFENLRLVANQMQEAGRLEPAQAELVRRIIQQVEQELASSSK